MGNAPVRGTEGEVPPLAEIEFQHFQNLSGAISEAQLSFLFYIFNIVSM